MIQRLVVLLLAVISITYAIRCYEDSNKKDKFTTSKTAITCKSTKTPCNTFCTKFWLKDPPGQQNYEWDCGCETDQSGSTVYDCLQNGTFDHQIQGQAYWVQCCQGDLCNTAANSSPSTLYSLCSSTLLLIFYLSR